MAETGPQVGRVGFSKEGQSADAGHRSTAAAFGGYPVPRATVTSTFGPTFGVRLAEKALRAGAAQRSAVAGLRRTAGGPA